MKVSITKESKKEIAWYLSEVAKDVCNQMKEDENTVSDYAVMAVNAIGAAYGIGRCERVFESSARIATNCRVHGLFSDYSENLDVWIEGTAKTTDGFVEFGAYLSDIWHIDGENDSDIAFCHMYSQLFKRV